LPCLGGIVKGSSLGDGGLCVQGTIVKTKGLGDATRPILVLSGLDTYNGKPGAMSTLA
jgi:hypothetical protein